jgi:hypothetical protein
MTPALLLRPGAVARITGYTDRRGHWIIVSTLPFPGLPRRA